MGRLKEGDDQMSKPDTEKATPSAEQSGEPIDKREALIKFGKYTAPAMLAMLASADRGMAQLPISPV